MIAYGIKNCDTIKKARSFLNENKISYEFYDYKKNAPTEAFLKDVIEQIGLGIVVNKRGTTYRKLSDNEKEALEDKNKALPIIINNSSIIKRPIVHTGNKYIVGFNKDEYKELLNAQNAA